MKHKTPSAVWTMVGALVAMFLLQGSSHVHAASRGILIYGPSLAKGVRNEKTIAETAGHTVTVASARTWRSMNTSDFAGFDAIVFGDPNCPPDAAPLRVAEATRGTWSAAVTGAKVIAGTDPILHQTAGGIALTRNAIDYAASESTTGLYLSLSCYYFEVARAIPLRLLSDLGTFRVRGQVVGREIACLENVELVDPTHPVMDRISAAALSNWGCSIHERFTSFPPSFEVLARDGFSNIPYIIATPRRATVSIDVKPDSETNPIAVAGRGVIPVAILTTQDFDATVVEPGIVCFGDREGLFERDCSEKHGRGHVDDVDHDGDLDLMLHFEAAETGIDSEDTRACLTGEIFNDVQFEGCDDIQAQ